MVKLGDRVKDKISGLKGIVVARTEWLYGCVRVTIQPEEVKEGKPAEMATVDEPQLMVVKRGVVADRVEFEQAGRTQEEEAGRHGARPDVGRKR